MAQVFGDLRVFREFSERFPVSYEPSGPHLVNAVLELWRRRSGSGSPSVAIVDFSDVKTRADQEILQWVFRSKGVPCVLVDPREMRGEPGTRLFAGELAIDLVYRRAVLSELLAREAEVATFLDAYPAESGPVRQQLPLPALGGQGVPGPADGRRLRAPAL